MLAYAMGLLIGEAMRDDLYGPEPLRPENAPAIQGKTHTRPRSKRDLYSGLFILLKQKPRLPAQAAQRISRHTFVRFSALVQHPVRTCV
jgi:hypothetical protein